MWIYEIKNSAGTVIDTLEDCDKILEYLLDKEFLTPYTKDKNNDARLYEYFTYDYDEDSLGFMLGIWLDMTESTQLLIIRQFGFTITEMWEDEVQIWYVALLMIMNAPIMKMGGVTQKMLKHSVMNFMGQKKKKKRFNLFFFMCGGRLGIPNVSG